MAANEQISITLSFKKEDAALIQVQQQVNSFLNTLQKGMTLGVGIKLADSILALPGQLRAAVSAGVEYATMVRNMALETRTTASSFQVISLLANQYGVQVNLLTTAIQHMSTVAGEAVNGTAKQAQAFKDLGINAESFSALSVPAQLQELAQSAARAGWSTESLNAIAEILGRRSAPQLMGVLHELAVDGFGGVSKAAIEAGAVLSDQLDQSVAEVGNKWRETGQIWKVTGSEIVEVIKPIIELMNGLSNVTARLLQRILLGSQLLANDIKAIVQTIAMFHNHEIDPKDFTKTLSDNIDIAGAKINAKWDPTVTTKAGGGLPVEGSAAAAKKNADEVARLNAELAELQRRSSEAAMTASQKAADLAQRVTEANKAILDYSRGHSADDPELKKLEIARERLQIDYQAAQAEADRADKEAKAAADRATKQAQEKADRAALAQFDASEIPLKEQLRSIEQDRSLITQNNLIDSVTKQARLNENAEQYRKTIAKIVELEMARLKIATDPREIARLKADIEVQKGDASRYGVSQKPLTREQQSAASYGALGDPANHFQSNRGGLVAGLQDLVSGMGTVADQIHGHAVAIGNSLSTNIGNALYGLETRTMSFGNAFRSVAMGLVTSLVQSGNEMVAHWIITETAKTAISASGSAERGVITGAETVVNVVHAGIRFAAHVASEIGKTAVTLAQAPLRITSVIAESMANIANAAAGAMSAMASIPYVGPFLALGAMAAIIAAGASLVRSATKGFRTGGYTGDGPEDGEAGVVHYGEGVLTARAMRMPGAMAALGALNAGNALVAASALAGNAMARLGSRASGISSARASSQKSSAVGILVSDDRQNLMRQLRSSPGQKTIVETMRDSRGMLFV